MGREKSFCCCSVRGFLSGSFLLECKALFGSRQAGSAALAQLVEQFIRNEEVDSSIPSSGTTSSQQTKSKSRPERLFFRLSSGCINGLEDQKWITQNCHAPL
jgi:hypothetical protein